MPAASHALVWGALMAPLLATAGSGQIDSFGASASSVVEGSAVDFFASFSLFAHASSDGGSDLNEPAPVEGSQTWLVNWYRSEQETLREVQLHAAGFSSFETLSLPPGASHSGNWSFSVLYPGPGQFSVTLSGSWSSDIQIYYSSETATRDCFNVDPGGSNELQCSSWQFSYGDYTDSFSAGGSFASQTLLIEVTAAPVPEPAALLLWLAGLAPLLGRSRGATRPIKSPTRLRE